MHINSLPDDILLVIISSLPNKSLFATPSVCKRWSQLCDRDDLWKKVCDSYQIEKPCWHPALWKSFYRTRVDVIPRLLKVPKKISLKEKFKPTLSKEQRNAILQRIPSTFIAPYDSISSLLETQKLEKHLIEKTLQHLVHIFHYAGDDFALMDLTKKHIRLEIQTLKSPNVVATKLFRSRSVACKLFIELSYVISYEYLRTIMGPLIQGNSASNTTELMKDFEDDAYKAKLATTTEAFLTRFYNSVDDIPIIVRELMLIIYEDMKALQCSEEDIRTCIVELFIFRMIIPGMLSSSLYQEGTPSHDVIGIAQILRNIATNMRFGEQTQKYFTSLNPLIDTHHNLMKDFLIKTIQIPNERTKNFNCRVSPKKRKEILQELSDLFNIK